MEGSGRHEWLAQIQRGGAIDSNWLLLWPSGDNIRLDLLGDDLLPLERDKDITCFFTFQFL